MSLRPHLQQSNIQEFMNNCSTIVRLRLHVVRKRVLQPPLDTQLLSTLSQCGEDLVVRSLSLCDPFQLIRNVIKKVGHVK